MYFMIRNREARFEMCCFHIWVSFCRMGKMSKFCIIRIFFSGAFLWPNGLIFSRFLNCFGETLSCTVYTNTFVLVVAFFSNFNCFYPQSAMFGNFWGQYRAFVLAKRFQLGLILCAHHLGKLYLDDFSFFWFLSSSFRTQVTAVWS